MWSSERILLSPPDVGTLEREALIAAFDSNWISTVGPEVDAFERDMESDFGRPCAAVSSGTAGIHLALRLAGVERGDTVLCQSLTFVASANPILYEGASPFFLDSEEQTWNLDPDLLEAAILTLHQRGVAPKALIVVHLYGIPARMERIAAICKAHGIYLIEDAAEALGARIGESRVGAFGNAAVFSFNGNKIITTAGGGMVVLGNDRDASKVRKWSTQSRESCLHYEHTEVGFNYRMSNLLAAVGRAQYSQIEEKVTRRRAIASRYKAELRGKVPVRFLDDPPGTRPSHWLSCMLLQGDHGEQERDALISFLGNHGIESRPLWKPMHLQPLFRCAGRLDTGVSEGLFRTGLCLPSSSALTESQQDHVIETVKRHFENSSRTRRRNRGNQLNSPSCAATSRDAFRSQILKLTASSAEELLTVDADSPTTVNSLERTG